MPLAVPRSAVVGFLGAFAVLLALLLLSGRCRKEVAMLAEAYAELKERRQQRLRVEAEEEAAAVALEAAKARAVKAGVLRAKMAARFHALSAAAREEQAALDAVTQQVRVFQKEGGKRRCTCPNLLCVV